MERTHYAKTETYMLRGCDAIAVLVETAVEKGPESLTIIGLPDTDVLESKCRVRSAVLNSGFSWPRKKIIVNLSPADIRKQGTSFDLAIAAAILSASGQIDPKILRGRAFVGELTLGGDVIPTRGAFCHALLASRGELELVCGPSSPYPAGSVVREIKSLKEIAELGNVPQTRGVRADSTNTDVPDMAELIGENMEHVKRAAVIAAAGRHNLLLIGPPGCGKTMIARRVQSVLPGWKDEDYNEAASAWSAAGLDVGELLHERPFRAPHHSASLSGLIGGGRPVLPGEVTLAHGGVLYLDGIQEFSPNHLLAIRNAMDEEKVKIVRAEGRYEMPASFLLVASALPCPCGHFGYGRCTCTEHQIIEYRKRLAGPLADRFDIVVEMAPLSSAESGTGQVSDSTYLREKVERASAARAKRDDSNPVVSLSPAAKEMLQDAATGMALSGRCIVRTAAVARTIADLDGCKHVSKSHISEAMSYIPRQGALG